MDLATKTAAIAEILKSRGETVAVLESSTGGLVSASLLAVPGASAYYLGGGVIYTQTSRAELARVTAAEMEGIRAATETYAELLAGKARDIHGATWGISETGATGPAGNRYGDDPGHTCFAIAGPRSAVRTLETGSADRNANMWTFRDAVLDLFAECLGTD